MASWGGEGPPGKTCRECRHWWGGAALALYFASGGLKPQHCQLAVKRMSPAIPKVPFYALACKHFEFNSAALPAIKERK
jgi:hypothetical protein